MRFGFYLPNQDPPRGERIAELYREILDLCAVGDAHGFASAFASEHHGREDCYIPSPLVLCSAAAARTTRLEVATGIMVLPLWHPIRVAEDGAIIDVISGGRFSLGVGLGLVDAEFRMYGVDVKRAFSRFAEQIEIVRLAWTEERFSYRGRHFVLDDVSVTPKPLRKPCPPIRIGGMSDAAVARAGRLGDAWLTDPLHGMDALKHWAGVYREAAVEAGRTPSIHLMRDCWITDGDLYEEWGRFLEHDWRYYYDLGSFRTGRFNPAADPSIAGLAGSHELTFELIRRDRVLAGTAEQVAGETERWIAELEPDQVNLRFRFPYGPDHASVVRAMERFATEVAPRFAAPAGAA